MTHSPDSFRIWLDQAIAEAPRSESGIPLIGAEALDLRDTQAAPLIVALADIVEALCVSAVPTTHTATTA